MTASLTCAQLYSIVAIVLELTYSDQLWRLLILESFWKEVDKCSNGCTDNTNTPFCRKILQTEDLVNTFHLFHHPQRFLLACMIFNLYIFSESHPNLNQ